MTKLWRWTREWYSNVYRQKWMLVMTALPAIALLIQNADLVWTMVFKFALVVGYAVTGYYIDRALFPYSRPHDYLDEFETAKTGSIKGDQERSLAEMDMYSERFTSACYRRAIICVGAMIAGSLAV